MTKKSDKTNQTKNWKKDHRKYRTKKSGKTLENKSDKKSQTKNWTKKSEKNWTKRSHKKIRQKIGQNIGKNNII